MVRLPSCVVAALVVLVLVFASDLHAPSPYSILVDTPACFAYPVPRCPKRAVVQLRAGQAYDHTCIFAKNGAEFILLAGGGRVWVDPRLGGITPAEACSTEQVWP